MNKYQTIGLILLIIIPAALFFFKWKRDHEIIGGLVPAKYESKKYQSKFVYRYFIPKNDENSKMPLIIYLHGGGGRGSDNRKYLDSAALKWSGAEFQEKHPCYVLIPQCPKYTQFLNADINTKPYMLYDQDKFPESTLSKMIIDLIQEFSTTEKIDTNRIYLIGFSMGASGIWDMVTRYPYKFSAAIMVSGIKDTSKVHLISHLPIQMFHGKNDKICSPITSISAAEALNKIGAQKYSLNMLDAGHVCEMQAYNTPGLIDWLFDQNKLLKDSVIP